MPAQGALDTEDARRGDRGGKRSNSIEPARPAVPNHRGKIAQTYLNAHPATRSVLLPPYAPELNPIEYAWGHLKHNPLANCPSFELDTLTNTTRYAARSLQANERLLRSFIQHSPSSFFASAIGHYLYNYQLLMVSSTKYSLISPACVNIKSSPSKPMAII